MKLRRVGEHHIYVWWRLSRMPSFSKPSTVGEKDGAPDLRSCDRRSSCRERERESTGLSCRQNCTVERTVNTERSVVRQEEAHEAEIIHEYRDQVRRGRYPCGKWRQLGRGRALHWFASVWVCPLTTWMRWIAAAACAWHRATICVVGQVAAATGVARIVKGPRHAARVGCAQGAASLPVG